MPGRRFLGEVEEGSCNFGVVLDEVAVIAREPKEFVDFRGGFGGRPVFHLGDFLIIHADSTLGNCNTKELNFLAFEGTFGRFKKEVVVFKFGKDFVDESAMSEEVFMFHFMREWSSVDGHVVHIDGEPELGHFLTEDGVHHGLEGCRRVGEAEEHDCWFKQSLVCEEGGFPFVPFFDANVIVTPADVKLGVQGATAKAVYELGNEG